MAEEANWRGTGKNYITDKGQRGGESPAFDLVDYHGYQLGLEVLSDIAISTLASFTLGLRD
jgi:hypothetical protein